MMRSNIRSDTRRLSRTNAEELVDTLISLLPKFEQIDESFGGSVYAGIVVGGHQIQQQTKIGRASCRERV